MALPLSVVPASNATLAPACAGDVQRLCADRQRGKVRRAIGRREIDRRLGRHTDGNVQRLVPGSVAERRVRKPIPRFQSAARGPLHVHPSPVVAAPLLETDDDRVQAGGDDRRASIDIERRGVLAVKPQLVDVVGPGWVCLH